MTCVWIGQSATSFACVCETCLDQARSDGTLFADALRRASVRGEIHLGVPAAVARCAAGHAIVLRRVERPPSLQARDERQLQLA